VPVNNVENHSSFAKVITKNQAFRFLLTRVVHAYWHCPHSMQSRIYVTVRCPSVCLSVCMFACPIDRSQPRRAASLLLGTKRAGDIDRQRRAPGARQQRRHSTGLQQQMQTLSRLQPRRRRLNTDLFSSQFGGGAGTGVQDPRRARRPGRANRVRAAAARVHRRRTTGRRRRRTTGR